MSKVIKFIRKFKYEILVFLFFVLVRLPSLGHDIFNTDVWKWKSRSYDFGSGIFTLNFEKTIQKYHPGVSLMWVGTAAVKAFNLYAEVFDASLIEDNNIRGMFSLHFTQKFFLITAIGLVVANIFYILRKLFDEKTALITVSMFMLEPYYVGLTRVFHLEGLMSTCMIASALWLYWYIVDQKDYKLTLSAVFTAIAVLTKTSSLFIVFDKPYTTPHYVNILSHNILNQIYLP